MVIVENCRKVELDKEKVTPGPEAGSLEPQ
jgi:hypothetical protein